ncbi:hypothetical protein A4X20_06955 [Mycolicibacterium iranicum]|uniref:Uncharacterized protein n=1 Tax=Mycolicibacterium iranicum TaxID=912594 RepID=A0A178LSE5_MYCIR|nr:hypothetical protein A4X20_06955 [Mycolicibacterium iranicum]
MPHAFTETWRPPTEPQTSADPVGVCGKTASPSVISDKPIALAVLIVGILLPTWRLTGETMRPHLSSYTHCSAQELLGPTSRTAGL